MLFLSNFLPKRAKSCPKTSSPTTRTPKSLLPRRKSPPATTTRWTPRNISLQFNTYPQFAKAEVTNSYKAFAVPASKRSRDKQSYSRNTLVFLCGEGHFAKQTMEQSDFVCVRNEPRSKLFNEKQVWTCLKRSPPSRG